jgi:hypothetical protein
MPGSAPPKPRTFFWYVKFVLACYGAGLGAAVLLLLAVMPFVGLRSAFFERHHGVEPFGAAMLIFAIAFAPLIWRRLR